MKGRVLIIAGSDPSGGAGLQADIKTVTALGGYACAAVTALTVQNTTGVFAAHPVEPDLVIAQARAALDDIGADAIKIGMLPTRAAAAALAAFLREGACGVPVVLDPVLVATSGDVLAGDGVASVILKDLMPLAAIVTPNGDELAALAGRAVRTVADARAAARTLQGAAPAAAFLLKGGHLGDDPAVTDTLLIGDRAIAFEHPRLAGRPTHGTGCTLASALATGLAQGLDLERATDRAIQYVRQAILTAEGFGRGALPLNHAFNSDGRR